LALILGCRRAFVGSEQRAPNAPGCRARHREGSSLKSERKSEQLGPGLGLVTRGGKKQNDECFRGTCGRWELETLSSDLKEKEVLGIEVGRRRIKVVPMALDGGRGRLSAEPVSVDLPAHSAAKNFPGELDEGFRKLLGPLKWQGVVGCSVTQKVAVALGFNDASSAPFAEYMIGLLRRAGLQDTFTHIMIQTEAAGYGELASAREQDVDESWRQLVLVATLGNNLGAVLINDGHRVKRSGLGSLNTSDLGAGNWSELPQPFESTWPAYAGLIDNWLLHMIDVVKPDRVLLVPCGVASLRPTFLDDLFPLLTKTLSNANVNQIAVEGSATPQHAVVRGAGLAALVQLRSLRARESLKRAMEGKNNLAVMSPAQLRASFDAFDVDASGDLSYEEVRGAFDAMGVPYDTKDVFSQDLMGLEAMSFENFCAWWRRYIVNARVLSITSADNLREIVQKSLDQVPGGFGPLVVFEVTFSFCRACRSFVRKYEKLAEKYPDVRFATIVGNYDERAMDLVNMLNVTKAPAFFVYERGTTDILKPMCKWSGSSQASFEEKLLECKGKLKVSA